MLKQWPAMGPVSRVLAAAVLLAIQPSVASAAGIMFLCATALRGAVEPLIPEFEQSTGHLVSVKYQVGNVITDSIRNGEPADVAIVSAPDWKDLRNEGKIDLSARADLGAGFAAAIPSTAMEPAAARALVQFLVSPKAAAAMQARGLGSN